ncbi:ATP-binding protein [Treponema sp.]|uniref:ATP-binding protein n=1 Tax=Treponema sp. TaxID=166 RepID=UPI0025F3C4CF|nr:ATP-binding protein [Treponema sp.]MBR4322594.1 ATP-binding protein [Treponema sp.]
MIIERSIKSKLLQLLKSFPVVTLTGCRQCGKSTLLKHLLPDYTYISLEDLDLRQIAKEDPRHFISIYSQKVIIDEIQQVPELLSYLQTHIDSVNESGMYVLTGSHNLLLMQSISQSLAGRTALLSLAPFSVAELRSENLVPQTTNEMLFKGSFPRIYDKQIEATDFYPSYIKTYIDRDVRILRNINDYSAFTRFLKLCAGRCSQILNVTALAEDAGITRKTAEAWLSVLEASYIIYLLKPYYKNFGKRIIKNPKMYFYDTGLVSSLLGITSAEQIENFYMRGALFENFVVSELLKRRLFAGKSDELYFWRDSNGIEIDVIEEDNLEIKAYEIKASETMNTAFFSNIKKVKELTGLKAENTAVIYSGKTLPATKENGAYICWKEI